MNKVFFFLATALKTRKTELFFSGFREWQASDEHAKGTGLFESPWTHIFSSLRRAVWMEIYSRW